MSVSLKKKMLINYFRNNGGLPKGSMHFDADNDDIGNVYINDSYFGTFYWRENKFINLY